eukprot:TRINITY_DN95157_c0_g1_i1.p1 TRINITY_DN95157_c0_g1~~TRINITY_DN95157_c0_g1_i1.p1  ORF type:complete len:362 (+),score=54.93 TRINITY_DN95157_c0_g1_i1:52-1137(+)
MLEPLHGTYIGSQLLLLFMGLSWTLGGVMVAVACAGFVDHTYGLSLVIWGVVAIESKSGRQAWAIASLLPCACLCPRSLSDEGFLRCWGCWLTLAVMSWVMWFTKFQPSRTFMKVVQDIGFAGYFRKLELRGHLESVHKEGCLFGFHPHGVLSTGFSTLGVWGKKFHDVAGTDTQFLIDKVLREDNPFFKVICDLHGNIETLSKSRLHASMAARRNVAFVPGGFEDATVMTHGKDIIMLKKRTGFIKYALQYGYSVYPVYTFGESSTHYTFTGLLNFRLWLNSFGIPAVAVFGCPWMPLMPLKGVSLLTYVGQPVKLPHIKEPSKEDVEKWHAVYCDAVRQLFEEKKKEAGLPDSARLEIR